MRGDRRPLDVGLVALLRETTSIPIVAAGLPDPGPGGLIQSLARPGGNLTGFVHYDPSLAEKWLEVLKSVAPHAGRAAVLFNPEAGPVEFFTRVLAAAAPSLGIEPVFLEARSEKELEKAVTDAARMGAAGLIIIPDLFVTKHRRVIARLASEMRLPAVYPNRYFVESGGLLSYSADTHELIARAASYVDRILRGASAAELPIQRPTKYELVINLRTARAMGLDIPAVVLARADEVIE